MCGSDNDLKDNHRCRAARPGHRYVVPPTKVAVVILHGGVCAQWLRVFASSHSAA